MIDLNITHVVSAAIISDGRILLAQRAGDTSFPWTWCTPGGKVEPGENPVNALRRELREELGVNFAEGIAPRTVFCGRLGPPLVPRCMTVTCYRLDGDQVIGAPRPGDKTVGLGWFNGLHLPWLELAPADHAGHPSFRAELLRREPERPTVPINWAALTPRQAFEALRDAPRKIAGPWEPAWRDGVHIRRHPRRCTTDGQEIVTEHVGIVWVHAWVGDDGNSRTFSTREEADAELRRLGWTLVDGDASKEP